MTHTMWRGLFYAGSTERSHVFVDRFELAPDTVIGVPKEQLRVRGERRYSVWETGWVPASEALGEVLPGHGGEGAGDRQSLR